MKRSFNPKWLFILCAFSVVISVLLIFGFILVTAWPVIQISGLYLILGSSWNYNTHQYGMFTFIIGTILLAILTLVLAVPVGLLTAIYLAEYASTRIENTLRSLIELLVGIPSVVYGIFGFFVLERFFRDSVNPGVNAVLGFIPFFHNLNPDTGEGFLLSASVLAIMTLPTIVSLSHESLKSVPATYREASLALGATRWETIRYVMIPAGISGILTSIVLGAMRAMGETMAVIMLIGGSQQLPRSILDTGVTLTAKILGDSSYYLTLPEGRSGIFAMAMVLFAIEIFFVALIRVVNRRFRQGGA
jgi:phosphate transport system permease protein